MNSTAPGPSQAHRLSEDIGLLIEKLGNGDVTVREVLEGLRGRAYMALLFLLSISFCSPLAAIPGLSMPFGVIIAVLGLRMALRRQPWLPRKLMDLRLPHRVFPTLLRAANRMVRGIEKVSKTRHEGIVDSPVMEHLAGACICFCGFVLCLPLPVPMSNVLPAAAVVALSMASISRDGVLALVGYAITALTACFVAFLVVGGAAAVVWLKEHVFQWLQDAPVEDR